MARGLLQDCERVLLVDDDEDTLESLEDVLTLEGVRDVRRARSLAEADHVLASGFLPGAVVLDLLLGNEQGETLIGRMKSDQALAGIPVIALSGHYPSLAKIRKQVAGVVLKPADPDLVVKILSKLCKH